MTKKILIPMFLFLIGFVALTTPKVSAAEQRYTSYVDMPGGSSLVGSARDFAYDYHKISL